MFIDGFSCTVRLLKNKMQVRRKAAHRLHLKQVVQVLKSDYQDFSVSVGFIVSGRNPFIGKVRSFDRYMYRVIIDNYMLLLCTIFMIVQYLLYYKKITAVHREQRAFLTV